MKWGGGERMMARAGERYLVIIYACIIFTQVWLHAASVIGRILSNS